ncbi:MAG: hypothetical protein ABI305_03330, partial [Tepidiformaceae bacterium]
MEPTYSSVWLELVIVSLVTSFVARRRLSVTQEPALCAAALAAGANGRTAILRATCASSESSWARLIRLALREPSPYLVSAQDESGYRVVAERTLTSSEPIARLVAGELARIRRDRAIGLIGAGAALAFAAVLLPALRVLMTLLMLAALASGWRVIVNGRRALAAFGEAVHALPEIVAMVPPPPPPLALVHELAPRRLRVRTVGFLGGFFAFGFGLGLVIPAIGLLMEMNERVPAKELGVLFGIHLMLLPFAAAVWMLLSKVNAVVDLARGDIVFVHRLVGITYARVTAPLEIASAFCLQHETGSRGLPHLAIEVGHTKRHPRRDLTAADCVLLVRGDGVAEVAIA